MECTAALSRADHDCNMHLPIVTGTIFPYVTQPLNWLIYVMQERTVKEGARERLDEGTRRNESSSRLAQRAVLCVTGRVAMAGCLEDSRM